MPRKRRYLECILLFILAVGATAPTAAADEFVSEAAPDVTLTGAQEKHKEGEFEKNDRLTTKGGVLECSTATYKGLMAGGKAVALSLAPAYSGCTFAGIAATVDVNECQFVFRLNEGETTGASELACPAGKETTITVGPEATRRCVIHIPSQTFAGVAYSNIGSGTTREVTAATSTGSTLKYSETEGSGSGKCTTNDSATTGSYIGALKATGENGGGTEHVGVTAAADEFVSEAAPDVTLTGAQEKHKEGEFEKNDRLTTKGGVLECSTATYKGLMAGGKAVALSLAPAYSGCTFAGIAATVDVNECQFVFRLNEGETTGASELACPAGKETTITVGPEATRRCVIHIPSQTFAGVAYSNIGSGTTREVTAATSTGSTLKYSETEGSGSGKCTTNDSATTGSYIGALKATGENGGGTEHVGVTAAADEFVSEAAPDVTLTGAQEKHKEGEFEKNDRLTTKGGVLECSTATYKGLMAGGKAVALSLAPAYSGCTFAGIAATVDVNECQFVFRLNEGETTGASELACPAGKETTITVGPEATRRCVIHIPSQTFAGVAYSNIGSGTTREVTAATSTGSTLKYSETEGSGSGKCTTNDSATTGSYIGALKATGENGGGTEHVGVFVG